MTLLSPFRTLILAGSLGNLDRSSQRDCEALVSGLVQFELLLRDAERSALWNPTAPMTYRDVRIGRLQERAAGQYNAVGRLKKPIS